MFPQQEEIAQPYGKDLLIVVEEKTTSESKCVDSKSKKGS